MVRLDNRCHRVTSKSDDSNSASVMHDVAVRRAAPKPLSLDTPKRVICRPTPAHGSQLVRALSQQTVPQREEIVPHQTAPSRCESVNKPDCGPARRQQYEWC